MRGGYGIGPAGRGPCGWLLDGVELDPVEQGALVDGPGVGGSPAEGLEVCLPGAADIVLVDRGEGNQFDRVDLNPAQSDRVTAPQGHFRPAPEPERDSDLARQDVLTQLFAELHLADSTSQLCGLRLLHLRLGMAAGGAGRGLRCGQRTVITNHDHLRIGARFRRVPRPAK